MKSNLLLFLLLVCSSSYSQEIKSLPEVRTFLDTHQTRGIKDLNGKTIIMPGMQNSLSKPLPGESKAKYIQTLPNGNMVFALPQDNMPCIVPNEIASAAKPNVSSMPTLPYRYKGPGAIPNPAVPFLMIKPKKK